MRGQPYGDYSHTVQVIKDYAFASSIVCGGGIGVEELAARYANEFKVPLEVKPPNIQRYGNPKRAFHVRNENIIDMSDAVLIITDSVKPIYVEVINHALKKGIPVFIRTI